MKMSSFLEKKERKSNFMLKREQKIRFKIKKVSNRARLSVFKSNTHIYAQLIDDKKGSTLASYSSLDKFFESTYPNPIQPPNVWPKLPEVKYPTILLSLKTGSLW